MAHKNYNKWHTRKSLINDSVSELYFYEREIWWVAIGQNVGDEEDGKGYDFARPVLVLRKFNRSLFYGLPISSVVKTGMYYKSTPLKGRPQVVLLSHLRDYDSKRLINKIGTMGEHEFADTQLKLITLLGRPPR